VERVANLSFFVPRQPCRLQFSRRAGGTPATTASCSEQQQMRTNNRANTARSA